MLKLDVPVIGILRGIRPAFFKDVMAASFDAGLQAIEITMNTEKAAEIVASSLKGVPRGKLLGMGTIRNIEEAAQAAEAGAMFFVTPNLDEDVIAYAVSRKIPVIAGAFTPTEVYRAWSLGADMVKVFPAGGLGPGYIRHLRGPFDRIPLVAVGGVNRENLADYFAAGARAVGMGSSLFGKEALADQDLDSIRKNVGTLIEYCKWNMNSVK